MSTLLPAGLAFRPGFAPEPQNEKMGGNPAGARPAEANAPAAKEETGSTTQQDGAKKPAPSPMGGCTGGGGYQMILMMVGIFAIMYFLMIRPQQKQEKKRKEMLSQMKKGDKVVTTAGLHATVADMDENTVTLKVDTKGEVRMRFDRGAVTRILGQEQG